MRKIREFLTIAIGCICAVVLAWILTGCASEPKPYDDQFCTVVISRYGMERCVAWTIGPGYGKPPLRR